MERVFSDRQVGPKKKIHLRRSARNEKRLKTFHLHKQSFVRKNNNKPKNQKRLKK